MTLSDLIAPPALTMHDLRPYQVEAIAAIEQEWEQGKRSTLLVLATGLGKTTCFSEIARRERDRGGRVLVLAHRKELVDQACSRMQATGLRAEVEMAERRASWMQWPIAEAVSASVMTLAGRRLKAWPRDHFSIVIVDECHHATSRAYRDIFEHFKGARILGVTATPARSDKVALGHVFESVAYELGIVEGVRQRYLCDLVPLTVPIDGITIDDVKVTQQAHGKDLDPTAIAKKVSERGPLLGIAASIVKNTLAQGRRTLVFMPSVETSHLLANELAAHPGIGVDGVRSLDSETSAEVRRQALADFASGKVKYIVNFGLFTEGFDAPFVECVAVVRMTKSLPLFMQMIGRGTRLFTRGDYVKRDCLILNFRPENTKHDLAEIVDIFDGKELDAVKKKDLKDAMSEGASVREAQTKANERSAARERRLAAERAAADLVADVSYQEIKHELWGKKPPAKSSNAPPPLAKQLLTMQRMSLEIAPGENIATASAKIKARGDEIAVEKKRRAAGLCTVKQSKLLAGKGLSGDLSFADARVAIDALAANNWKATAEMRSKWARKEG